jgi:hypothetical protein
LEIAAEILMSDDWPLHDRTCERAAEKLIKALHGEATREEARAAFEAAAKGALAMASHAKPHLHHCRQGLVESRGPGPCRQPSREIAVRKPTIARRVA